MNAIPEEKLEKLTERWHAVQHELSNPLDQATFRKLSQEFAQLDPLVQTIKELSGLREEIAGLGFFEHDLAAGRISWSNGMRRLFGVDAGRADQHE